MVVVLGQDLNIGTEYHHNEYVNIRMGDSLKLYGLGLLERIIALCLYSAYLVEEKPLSLMIVAKVGHGKSSVLQQFTANGGVAVMNQGTRYGLYTLMNTGGYSLKHVIIPDLSAIINAHPAIANEIMNLISTMVEEGVTGVQTYHFNRIFNPPLKVGILTAITNRDYFAHKSRFRKVGFHSRFLPFLYSYEKDILELVLSSIARGDKLQDKPIILEFPKTPVSVSCKESYVHTFKEMALAQEEQETRFYTHMRLLLKSCALAHGRVEVSDEDVEEVLKLVVFLNYGFAPIGSEV